MPQSNMTHVLVRRGDYRHRNIQRKNPCEDAGGRGLSASHEETLTRGQNQLALDLGLLSLQPWEKEIPIV